MKHRKVAKRVRPCALWLMALVSLSFVSSVSAAGVWQAVEGRTTLTLDEQGLERAGLTFTAANAQATGSTAEGGSRAVFGLESGSNLAFAVEDGAVVGFLGGELFHQGKLTLTGPKGAVMLQDFVITPGNANGTAGFVAVESARQGGGLEIGMIKAGVDPASEAFVLYGGEVRLSRAWAEALGDLSLTEISIGTVLVEARAEWIDGDPPMVTGEAAIISDDEGGTRGGQDCDAGEEPDVIVGDLQDQQRWGAVGGITAYSVGTYSCNPGTCWLNWFDSTPQHPVIAQNMFRLKTVDGAARFEQIGMSWLKHGFFALSNNLCFSDCQGTNGDHLGIHCADPYNSGLNGQQSNLGPRSQVNASTGVFPYPFSAPGAPATIGRRLQVHDTDLDPAQNSGALYFVEGHYVAADDAASGNGNNNASYRRVNVGASPYNLSFVGGFGTVREAAGIRAWQDHGLGPNMPDVNVQERDIQVPGDGLFILAAKATNLGNGFHRYEYAIQNLNSHRSARSFSVPIPPGTAVQNAAFHDVDSHSGEPYELTDWSITVGPSSITWSTSTFDQNQNANALRWGTLYNFRFDATALPSQNTVTLGLYRTGVPAEMTASVVAPPSGPPDCNFNGIGDPTDIALGTSQDCDANNTPDECQLTDNDCNGDEVPDHCQLAGNDCNGNSTPDDCEPDCNANGTADACDISGGAPDCDANGVPDDCQTDCDSDGTPDTCEVGIILFQDDFETDKVWTVESDSPIIGMWERAVPEQTLYNGEVVQPNSDNPGDAGSMCFVTDHRGTITSSYDVDNGPTWLVSPTLDLTGGASTISYAYWFFTVQGTPDTMTLEVSNDDGGSWVTMYTHTTSASEWRQYSALVDNFITRTASMRFRFVISDPVNDSFTEGLIDDVVVTTPDCPSTCQTPAATLTGACSNKLHNGVPCCIPITGVVPGESSEPRSGGIEEVQMTFDQNLCTESFTLGAGAVSIEETTTALYPAWQAWSAGSIMTTSGAGNTLTLSFSPPLADRTTYRIHVTSAVTTVSGQSVDVRGLTGDATGNGTVDSGDRSAVVGVWTGSGFSCATDISLNGTTDSGDRSAVVGAWTSGNNTAP